MEADRNTCPSCMGTGIGNPHVAGSVCSACHGRGVIQPPKAPADDDRWAWNHFEPEPGDEDEQYQSWQQVSAGAADSHAADPSGVPVDRHQSLAPTAPDGEKP